MVKIAKLRLSSMPMSNTKSKLLNILKSVEEAPLKSEEGDYCFDYNPIKKDYKRSKT